MQEPYRQGLASQPGPESCVGLRKEPGEALTGEDADQALSCEINTTRGPTPLTEAEGHTGRDAQGQSRSAQAQSKTLYYNPSTSSQLAQKGLPSTRCRKTLYPRPYTLPPMAH